MDESNGEFRRRLQEARVAAGLSRAELARRVGLDTSYVYRIEVGGRRPSREAVLALGEALGQAMEETNQWLVVAGYAPAPLLDLMRGPLQTRGVVRRRSAGDLPHAGADATRWATWLEAIGLQEPTIQRLLRAMDDAKVTERRVAAQSLAAAFARTCEVLEAPVRHAVIPAAGGEHRLLATEVMQRLVLRAITEAADSGIARFTIVLPPGRTDSMYTPIAEALTLAVAPPFELHAVEQPTPAGLGDAILQVEKLVHGEPFAVLLVDDVVHERIRGQPRRELRRMLDLWRRLDDGQSLYLVAATPGSRTTLQRKGVAELAPAPTIPGATAVLRLVEKPEPTDAILDSPQALAVVGRYLLHPDIFKELREVQKELKPGVRTALHLTAALERARQQGQRVFAHEIESRRDDLGDLLSEARAFLG